MEVRAEWGKRGGPSKLAPPGVRTRGWGTKTKCHLKGTVVLYYFWKFRHWTLVGCWITELQRGHKSPCLGLPWGFLCKVIQVFTFHMNSSCRGKEISVALWIFHRTIKKSYKCSNLTAPGIQTRVLRDRNAISSERDNCYLLSEKILCFKVKWFSNCIAPKRAQMAIFCLISGLSVSTNSFFRVYMIDFVNTRRPVSRFWKLIQK